MHSAQRARALDRLSSPAGVIAGAAVDHRDSLQAALAKRGIDLDDAGVTELKLRVAAALAPVATLILLDAELSAAQAIAAGVLPGATALVVPLEAMGYGDVARVEVTAFLEGWSAVKARRLGASGAKLLLPYRVDVPDQATRQEDVVRTAVAACREAGLALILEPIVYKRDGEERAGEERYAELVVEGARRLAALEPDVLKLQYPGTAAGCEALDAAVGRDIPWVLLGGGASEDVIGGQIEDACRAGRERLHRRADALRCRPGGRPGGVAARARGALAAAARAAGRAGREPGCAVARAGRPAAAPAAQVVPLSAAAEHRCQARTLRP